MTAVTVDNLGLVEHIMILASETAAQPPPPPLPTTTMTTPQLSQDKIQSSLWYNFDGRVVELLHQHTDIRRSIYEACIDDGRVVTYFFIHDGIVDCPLGKHYHGSKTEYFTILTGGGVLLTCEVDENGEAAASVQSARLTAGDHILMLPMVAHTFYLDPSAAMLCVSEPFDEMDNYPATWLVK